MPDLLNDFDQEGRREKSLEAPAVGRRSAGEAEAAPAVALYDLMHPVSQDRPLADRMRPVSLEEFLGQEKLVGPESLLRRLIERDNLGSMIFWGPPGSGKTTLATIVARASKARFMALSAVAAGVRDVKAIIGQARAQLRHDGQKTILFIDEIHRFNKAQQDALLPAVESGVVILIGATTENPSFSVISPLLSRCRVFTLEALNDAGLITLLRRALSDKERGLGAQNIQPEEGALEMIVRVSDGDARRALNLLELAAKSAQPAAAISPPSPSGPSGPSSPSCPSLPITQAALRELCQREHLIYDKTGEEHYNLISALHKSLRSSDVQASVYWCARMLKSGEDPRYVARRMIRFASEDIGLADPNALTVALNALETYQNLGTPEGELALIQAAVYLATAPKSNSAYAAELSVNAEIEKSGSLPVPFHIRNAPTGLMKALGYGKGYQYDHEAPEHFSGQKCLPEPLAGTEFYRPGEFGFERDIAKRMKYWESLENKDKEK